MKSVLPALSAAILCVSGCVSIDSGLGASMIPISSKYKIVSPEPTLIGVTQRDADSLSGFSQTRITIGSIRKSDEFGLTSHASVVTLVPLFTPEFNMGDEGTRIFKKLHFAAALDSTSVEDLSQQNILQPIMVYELTKPINRSRDFDCNGKIEHGNKIITIANPIANGEDSLSFDFTKEFGSKYMNMTAAMRKDFNIYMKNLPGFYMETNAPLGEGGRINIYKLQLGYDSSQKAVTGNYAELQYSAVYNGVRRDTSVLFYYCPTKFNDLDTLANNYGTGTFPQYALNLTSHEGKRPAGTDIFVEGGGGLKPVISAKEIRQAIIDTIDAREGKGMYAHAVLNRVSLNFSYVDNKDYHKSYKLPQILSPTLRIVPTPLMVAQKDTSVRFMGLTDSSSSTENQGKRNTTYASFNPDITYHAQELLGLNPEGTSETDKLKWQSYEAGNYDIWLLIMHNDVVTTTSSGNSSVSDYYNYLAYQSYMSNMYGGYGGYGGYGSYGYGSSYSNYMNYAMLAQMYGSSSTSTSSKTNLDIDRYYFCRLNGPEDANVQLRPTLTFIYSIPE